MWSEAKEHQKANTLSNFSKPMDFYVNTEEEQRTPDSSSGLCSQAGRTQLTRKQRQCKCLGKAKWFSTMSFVSELPQVCFFFQH